MKNSFLINFYSGSIWAEGFSFLDFFGTTNKTMKQVLIIGETWDAGSLYNFVSSIELLPKLWIKPMIKWRQISTFINEGGPGSPDEI